MKEQRRREQEVIFSKNNKEKTNACKAKGAWKSIEKGKEERGGRRNVPEDKKKKKKRV